jgi:hypothetical protein
MSNYDNTNKGIAFKQTSKTNEKAPDLKGKINVEGKEYELAGWIRQGKNGEFYSLSVSEPKPKQQEAKPDQLEFKRPAQTKNQDLPF